MLHPKHYIVSSELLDSIITINRMAQLMVLLPTIRYDAIAISIAILFMRQLPVIQQLKKFDKILINYLQTYAAF